MQQILRPPSGPVFTMNFEGDSLFSQIPFSQKGQWDRSLFVCSKEMFLKVQQAMYSKVHKGVETRAAVKLQIKMPGRDLKTGQYISRIHTVDAKFMIGARDLSVVLVELTKPLKLHFDNPIQTKDIQHSSESNETDFVLKQGTQIALHMKRMEWTDDIHQSLSPYISWSLVTGDLTWNLIL